MDPGSLEGRDMTTIRQLPGGPDPPLTHFTRTEVPYGQVIYIMQKTGFHVWNFLIVRATSCGGEHDQRWQTFLTTMRADAEDVMTRTSLSGPRGEATLGLMMPLLRWDVLEDQDKLERASVDEAKKAFIEWRAGTCSERDGEGADHLLVRRARVARFQYFVMVDDESLQSMPKGEVEGDGKGRRMYFSRHPPMKVRVVDAGLPENEAELCARAGLTSSGPPGPPEDPEGGDGSEDEEDDYDDEEVQEDEEDWDLGWMWVEASFLCGFYDIVQADSGWDCFYVRPPGVYGRDEV